jgi:DNA-binding transcriptional MerR regulator
MMTSAGNPSELQPALYSISTVAEMTGVNAVTLRAWERRYGLLQPSRTPSGHRLYSDDDVEQIKAILQMLDEGIAISRAARALQSPTTSTVGQASEPWVRYQSQMLLGVSEFNEIILEDTYNEAMSLYPVEIVTRQLLMPLLKQLGERWETEECGIAEEHFFSVFMRNKLGARFHHRNRQNTGPKLVLACLPYEHHEFGLLLLSLSLHARGYQLIMLGANMVLEQLPHIVNRTHSDGIILSGSVSFGRDNLHRALQQLVNDSNVPIFIGGPVTEFYEDAISTAGAISLGDDLLNGVKQLSQYFTTTSTR